MQIQNNPEAQSAMMQFYGKVPEELQAEYLALSSAPIPKAAFQISQLLYMHRADLDKDVQEFGCELLRYCTYVGQWNGLDQGLGQKQMDYMEKAMGVKAKAKLKDDDAPEIHEQSGIKQPDADVIAEPAVEEGADPAPVQDEAEQTE